MKTRSIPERLVRLMGGEVEIDLGKRILERAQIVTRSLASDGGIIRPDGINVKFYEPNPVVLARHGLADMDDARSMVIGRSLGLTPTGTGLMSRTQFADTELGREYAYLYGVNEKKEVYARGWSFGWTSLQVDWMSLTQARDYVGAELWSEDLVSPWIKERGEVWVASRSLMHEYSAVEIGADRNALTRAFKDGVKTAGRILSRLDLDEAEAELSDLKTRVIEDETKIEKLDQRIKALRRDEPEAAAQGNSSEILAEIRELVRLAQKRELLAGIGRIVRP